MRSIFSVVVGSLVCGIAVGVALAFVEVKPWVERPHRNFDAIRDPADATAGTAPRAVVPELVFNFGTIERGASMSHAFKVRNVGGAPLTLEVVSTTCKCTVGDLVDNAIAPGTETNVLLEWTAKTAPGPFRHGATLQTNDPSRPRVELSVEGNVVESTAMEPAELLMHTVNAGETGAASLYLMAFGQQEVEVSDWEISDPELAERTTIDVEAVEPGELPSPDAKAGVKITAVYDADGTLGPFGGWLTLRTNLKGAESLTVPLMGNVVGDVTVFHPAWNAATGLLRMGTVDSSEGRKVRLNVAVRGPHAPTAQLNVQQVDPPELQVSIGERRDLNAELAHFPVTVEVPVGTPRLLRTGGPISELAEIVLGTNLEKSPAVRMRVSVAVKE